MDNIENKNNKYTLLKLLEKCAIEIPRIQRDYAQGRNDNITTIIRNNFLGDIKSLLDGEKKELNLFYIYGKIENDKFYPLDGQQRLTTLFLLHIYAFSQCEEKTDILTKFSYVARTTTKDFFSKLVEYRDEIIADYKQRDKSERDKSDCSLKDIITDYSWFIYSWIYDPSVIGAITTLEDICKKFDGKEEKLRELLKSDRLFFYFTGIEDLGKEDDLYIKLNARGRQLTVFENFKSKFVDIIDSYSKDEKGKKYFTEIESEENRIDIKDFYNKLDTEWSDAIWEISKENKTEISGENIITYNEYFLNFFDIVLTNYNIKEHTVNGISWIYNIAYDKEKCIIVKKDNKEKDSQDITDTTDKSDEANVLYNILRLIRNTFNYIISDKKEENVYNYLKEAIKKPTYKNKIWFHVISKYLLDEDDVEKINQECFKEWILNFINDFANKKYEEKNSVEPFNLLKYFARAEIRDKKLKGFSTYQIKEECIKAHLMINKGYKKEIEEAERKLKYFSGQIGSAIYYSMLKKQHDDIYTYINNITDINNITEIQTFLLEEVYNCDFDIGLFKEYVLKIATIFNNQVLKDKGDLLRRAMLCYGDYRLLLINWFKSLCVENCSRDDSFKNLLLNIIKKEMIEIYKNEMIEIYKNQIRVIYQLLDKVDINNISNDNNINVEDILNKIIMDNIDNIKENDWRYCFIAYPEVFNKFKWSYRMGSNGRDEVLLRIPNGKYNVKKYSLYLEIIRLSFENNISFYYEDDRKNNFLVTMENKDKEKSINICVIRDNNATKLQIKWKNDNNEDKTWNNTREDIITETCEKIKEILCLNDEDCKFRTKEDVKKKLNNTL